MPIATVATRLDPEWLLPMEGNTHLLANHAVLINQGAIVDVLPAAEASSRYHAAEVIKLPGRVLMPGLVNAHTHAAMTLLRGFADDLPLQQWLNERIWPAENQFVGPGFVRDGTLLACQEMLSGGTTCFADMYFHADCIAEAALTTGIRAAIGLVVIDFPSSYASDAADYLRRGLAIRDRFAGASRLSFCLAPHAPYSVSDTALQSVAEIANELDIPIHIHVHETAQEVRDSVAQHGCRPLARLQKLGIVGPRMLAAHGVHLTPDEVALLAECGSSIAHCPTSNLKLASGVANVPAMLDAGVNLALGTDGAASNNRLDLWQEIHLAALLGKVTSDNAASMSSLTLLHAATLGGARALGLDQQIGSIVAGKRADLIAVALDHPVDQPCYDPVSHLVYVLGRERVTDVWVDGKCLKCCGRLISDIYSELPSKIRLWHTRIASSAPRGKIST